MTSTGAEATEGGEQIDIISMEQKEPLLRTKLFIPPLRPNRVNRPRLMERMNSGLDKALILVIAPAGYGKTTLVSHWLHETDLASAWISLDEGDNDPIRFVENFIAALQEIIPTIQTDWLGMLQGMQPRQYESVLRLIINEIAERPVPFALVLDDLHLIHTQAILEMLAFLLEHLPPQMHLVLLSRADPQLSLSRLRARDQLVELRGEQLRFTTEEITVFLNSVMGLRLSASDIVAMETRTEGWIAGLQLAALSMQGCDDIQSFVAKFTGSHYYVMDYLTEEVLNQQPEKMRTFLLQTSMLNSMCASLCEAVVHAEGTQPMDGQATLEALEEMNLFVIPLDDKRHWYRYHHLFADILKLRLERLLPQQLPELHRRAAEWYEQQGMISEAIEHTLAAREPSQAARLVEQNGCDLLMRGEGFTLLRWVEAVGSYTQTNPWLAILKAWAMALTGKPDEVEPTLQAAEKLFSPDPATFEVKIMLGNIATIRAHLANLEEKSSLAVDYAQRALEYLPDSNSFSCSLRSVATSILGDASWIDGKMEEARGAYVEAVQISQAAGNMFMQVIANTNLGNVLLEQGELHQAARIFSESLQIATRPDGQKLPLADSLYGGLSKIYYEWNQLESAARTLHPCLELCRQWGNTSLLANSTIHLARLERARGNAERALEAIRSAELLISERRLSPRQSRLTNIASARWWMDQGYPGKAAQILQQLGVTSETNPKASLKGDTEIPYWREPENLLLMRLQLAQGEQDAALSLGERLLQNTEAAKRTGRTIEIHILQALAWQGKKDLKRAVEALDNALTLSQPGGYRRIFLDEGEPMAKLLYQAKIHWSGNETISELLAAMKNDRSNGQSPAQLLTEPITLRELEVLKLIEAGCTNQEIADRLVISIPTVKRHISNIYTKLGAKSRTQAVSLAKELRLFD